MSKQIDLKALLESRMENIGPTESSKMAIERAEMNVPNNLMFDAESTEFKPETKPVTSSGARGLTVEDCFAGPEEDRNPKYEGWIFKFNPMFEDTQLYIKIRIENIEKSVCLSVHEFGKYDEVN